MPKPPLTVDTTHATDILSAKLAGMSPTLSKPSRLIQLPKAAPLPMPGSHAGLLRRLFGGKGKGKKDPHAHTG